jgi:TRAP-type C4-dicarboxylate transport system permease small subunit
VSGSDDRIAGAATWPPLRLLERVSGALATASIAVAAVALLGMALMITANVVLRALDAEQIRGVDELSGFLLLLVVFLPAADVMRRGEHINVDIVTRRLPGRVAATLRLIAYLIGLVFVGVFCWQAIEYHQIVGLLGQKTSVLLAPLTLVTPFMIGGLALLGLQILVLAIRQAGALRRRS